MLAVDQVKTTEIYEESLLLERTARDTATTITRRQDNGTCTADAAVVLEKGAVAAQAGIAAIKDRGFPEIVLVLQPVPVLYSNCQIRFKISRR